MVSDPRFLLCLKKGTSNNKNRAVAETILSNKINNLEKCAQSKDELPLAIPEKAASSSLGPGSVGIMNAANCFGQAVF